MGLDPSNASCPDPLESSRISFIRLRISLMSCRAESAGISESRMSTRRRMVRPMGVSEDDETQVCLRLGSSQSSAMRVRKARGKTKLEIC